MAVMNLQSFIEQADQAFFDRDFAFFEKNLTEDASWNVVGRFFVSGKTEVVEAMRAATAEMDFDGNNAQIVRDNLIANGNEAAVKGSIAMTLPNGDKKTIYYFDLYVLDSGQEGKIKEFTSFVIESTEQQEGGM
ncbi:nuclear transport factor 2 family protein [Planococcus sp. N028]|uniref:Nuclear transport factor 2 family protein n=1 Tax=Planococcus shixiaomingii TaxID=3058393 RepID=A0ABT8MYS6_9BACL|nr:MULTISPECIES: nuclear transport factor 2 family protein [unclassified Planococcus (in: firmicutes)]MDN7240794.1 nuclear transport factor 2 family protein [Planococcus sp. N028]WKA53044.1 nuclear transport factor 2 family protein [Planococcus sp. N022]